MYACMYVTTQSKDLFNLGRYLQSIFDKPSYVEQIYLLSTIHLRTVIGREPRDPLTSDSNRLWTCQAYMYLAQPMLNLHIQYV